MKFLCKWIGHVDKIILGYVTFGNHLQYEHLLRCKRCNRMRRILPEDLKLPIKLLRPFYIWKRRNIK